jgi:adenine-specific DNA-methyltransferase
MKQPSIPLDTIVLGDALEFLRGLPDSGVDLVVSSPPYNLGKEYEAKRALGVYLGEQKRVLAECVRVLKPTGSLFWQVGAFADRGLLVPLDIRFFPILESLGLVPRNRIVWARQHGVHGRRKFSCRHEVILWFTRSDDYVFNLDPIRVPQKYRNKKYHRGDRQGELSCNPGGKNPGDIWVFRNVKHNHEEQTIHPCQFPEDLIARIVLATTNPGGIVLDPYMGAGTVAVVARDHDRRFLGAEIEPKYHEVAVRRLSGLPDDRGRFPNLKTLRDYVERTGQPIDGFRFDVQVGKRPTERSKARIFSETHHLMELKGRLAYEEGSFGARLRDEPPPRDYFEGGEPDASTRPRKERPADSDLPLFPAED